MYILSYNHPSITTRPFRQRGLSHADAALRFTTRLASAGLIPEGVTITVRVREATTGAALRYIDVTPTGVSWAPATEVAA